MAWNGRPTADPFLPCALKGQVPHDDQPSVGSAGCRQPLIAGRRLEGNIVRQLWVTGGRLRRNIPTGSRLEALPV